MIVLVCGVSLRVRAVLGGETCHDVTNWKDTEGNGCDAYSCNEYDISTYAKGEPKVGATEACQGTCPNWCLAHLPVDTFAMKTTVLPLPTHILKSVVRQECLESAFEGRKSYLKLAFEPRKGEYAMYIDPTMPRDAVKDVIRFAEMHNWIDDLTREVEASFISYNPSTGAFSQVIRHIQIDHHHPMICKRTKK